MVTALVGFVVEIECLLALGRQRMYVSYAVYILNLSKSIRNNMFQPTAYHAEVRIVRTDRTQVRIPALPLSHPVLPPSWRWKGLHFNSEHGDLVAAWIHFTLFGDNITHHKTESVHFCGV